MNLRETANNDYPSIRLIMKLTIHMFPKKDQPLDLEHAVNVVEAPFPKSYVKPIMPPQ